MLHRSPRSRVVVAGGALAVLALLSTADAARPTPRIPGEVPPAERVRLAEVAEAASVSTRVEGEPFIGRRDVFEYLLDHPEFATHVTRALRLARYRIWRDAEGLQLDDGWGATGRFEVVFAHAGTRVMYARGRYEPRVLPNIDGRAVVVIEYGVQPAPAGRDAISTAVSGFVKIDNRLFALAGRLAGALVAAKADKEAHRLVKVFARATRAIDHDPAAVYEQISQRPDVPARELEEFRRLLSLR